MKLDQRPLRSAPPAGPDAARMRKLIEAAEKLFLKNGYRTTTMDEVATLAGVSKKTIYQAFSSKEALFAALVHARRAPFFAPVDTRGPADQVLTATLRNAVHFILSPKEIAMCRLIATEGARSPKLARAFDDEGSKPGQFALEKCLAALSERGDIVIGDTHATALMLLGMALGVTHIKLMLGLRKQPTKQEIDRQVREAVRVFLRGTAPRHAH